MNRLFLLPVECTMQLLKTMLWMNNVFRHFLVMTGRAGARHSPINDDGLAVRFGFRIVASGTRLVTVCPRELIALPRIVVEQGRFPFLFGVTAGAIRGAGRGKLAGVLIFMAARALLGRGIKNNRAPIRLLHVGLMAPLAGHLAVAPLENKTGLGVIETGQLRPGYRVVARATVAGGSVPAGLCHPGGELAPVQILMAGRAGKTVETESKHDRRRRIHVLVAIVADDGAMSAGEGKSPRLMPCQGEGRGAEADDRVA